MKLACILRRSGSTAGSRGSPVRGLDRRHADGADGRDSEIASVVLFLAGEGASLTTGSVVMVDGGYTCW